MSGAGGLRRSQAGAALAAIALATAMTRAVAGPHPLFTDGLEQYPQPVPLNQVLVDPELAPDPRVAELFARPPATRAGANEGVSLRVTGMGLRDGYPGLTTHGDQRLLVLDTEWRNMQPPQRVERDSAEGKADRTMGAGSLAAGSDGAEQAVVLADVGYKIPRLGDHIFLLADGFALDLAGGTIAPDQPLGIARQGDTRHVQLVFPVAADVQDVALHFFDYRQGHIHIDLAGRPEPSRPKHVQRMAGVIELDATAGTPSPAWQELEAPGGWAFQSVRLQGRSLMKSGKVASILELHPDSDFWLEIDGGRLLAPTPATGVNPALLRFTPEFFQQRELVFLVPEETAGSRLGLRLGNEVMRVETGSPLAPGPAALAEHQDGEAMRVRVYGLRRAPGAVILDLGVEPLLAGKGLEIATARQFALVVNGKRLPPDNGLTMGLAFGAGEALVAPPGTAVRFELAFATEHEAEALALKGFAGEAEIPLAALPLTEAARAAPAGTPLAGRLGQAKAAAAPEAETGAVSRATVSKAKRSTPARKRRETAPPPPPVRLPPAETEGLPREAEPNDKFAEATLISAGLTAGGFIRQGDRDFIAFTLTGEPQLWAIEANGAGIREMAYHDNSGQYTLRRSVPSNAQDPVTMTHLHLLPGRHTIGLVGRGDAESEYTLRMVPLGPPDPSLEREPNDLEEQANLVLIGTTRHGWLYDRSDKDVYRFSLQAEDRLSIVVTPPALTRISAQLGRQTRFESPAPGQAATHEGVFGPGDHTLELKVRGNESSNEPYSMSIERLNPFGESTGTAAALSFSGSAPVPSAHRPLTQKTVLPLRVENRSTEPQDLALSVQSSHWGWQVQLAESQVSLAPEGKREVNLSLDVMPDAWADHPVQIAVQATTSTGERTVAALELTAACDAPMLDARPGLFLPDALQGGLNLAWTALGAEALGGEESWRQADLYDGLTPNDKGWSVGVKDKDFPYELTVKLAGSGPTPVAGVVLNPQGSCEPEQVVKVFEVLLSTDGSEFVLATAGELRATPREQAWLLDRPVTATHARLRVLSNHGGNRGRLCLGEFKVVADPVVNPWPGKPLNIGLPALGGHVVWSRPLISQAHAQGLLSEATEKPTWNMDHLNNNEFVVGLHHNRAALITELQWVPVEADGALKGQIGSLQVSASMVGPTGPWKPLGRWSLEPEAGKTRPFRLDAPTWVRFLRFSNSEPEKPASWYLPETLRVIEAEHGVEYRSILAEWDHYGQNAFYELQGGAADGETGEPLAEAATPEQAVSLQPGEHYRGSVTRGERAEWYRAVVPKGHNSLEFTVHEGDADRLEISMQDGRQQPVDLAVRTLENGATIYTAAVEGGATYRLRVGEAERYIVIAWDNSGSVSPYKSLLYQSLGEFADDVSAGVEYVNFIPFQNPPASLLTNQWLDQPDALQTVLNDYNRKDSSSNTENNVLRAAEELGQRAGSRAVIVLTDAASHGYKESTRMWAALEEARPRIFALELHSGNPDAVPRQQDLMQDLAMSNRGHYSYFSSQADLDIGFRRASCMLRRPVNYALSMATRTVEPPEPGVIEVELVSGQTAGAIEIIFDASGSMWARMDGVPRIQIARDVLVDLINNTLPDGATVALRVFGNREAQSCRSDLEVAPGPLDRAALIGFIEDIQPQDRSRTPLADSLRQVENDLGKIGGTKLLILLTDGEESCDGDPDAAIAELKEQGMDIRLNIVGLAIEDDALKNSFSRWADAGGGLYFNAASQEQLGAALREAMLPKFQVLDVTDTVIAEGTAGSTGIEVPAGRYRVRVLSSPPFEFSDVTVAPAATTRISAEPR